MKTNPVSIPNTDPFTFTPYSSPEGKHTPSSLSLSPETLQQRVQPSPTGRVISAIHSLTLQDIRRPNASNRMPALQLNRRQFTRNHDPVFFNRLRGNLQNMELAADNTPMNLQLPEELRNAPQFHPLIRALRRENRPLSEPPERRDASNETFLDEIDAGVSLLHSNKKSSPQ